ncbi:MAG: hypothetical protein NTY77_13075 [Elusimicrobia bacterium]|nr:hypothetical protein [Elusimicrobiota bacterium]
MGNFKGMTTLDRLVAAGLLRDFELAVKRGARKAAVDILMRVELTEAQALVVYHGAEQLRQNFGA